METENGKLVKVLTATQGSYLPLTFLPKEYEGRKVRLVLVDEIDLLSECGQLQAEDEQAENERHELDSMRD